MASKKYTRKEFLKYLGKIGFGAALYGTGGNLIGRGYKKGKDFYENDIEPYIERGKKVIDKGEKIIERSEKIKENTDRFFDYFRSKKNKKYDKVPEKKKTPKKEQEKPGHLEKISRRSFFGKFRKLFHDYPIETGTGTGVAFGASKKAVGGYRTYRKEKKTNQLGRDVKELKEQVGALQDENEKLRALKELDEGNEGGLEEKLSLGNESLFYAGIIGLIVSIFLSTSNITGLVVLKDNFLEKSFSGIIFIASLLTLLLSFKKK